MSKCTKNVTNGLSKKCGAQKMDSGNGLNWNYILWTLYLAECHCKLKEHIRDATLALSDVHRILYLYSHNALPRTETENMLTAENLEVCIYMWVNVTPLFALLVQSGYLVLILKTVTNEHSTFKCICVHISQQATRVNPKVRQGEATE